MSSEIGSFVVSLKAKFEGYLSEVEKIKKAMSQVGADTKLGKNLAKELATVEKQVDALGRKLNQRISSEGLIVRLKDLLDGLDNKIKLIGQSLLGVKYEDLSPDYITDKFKDLENELDNIGKKMLSNFNLDSLKGNEKLVLIFKDLGISMKDVNLDNFKSTLTSALDESKKKASEYREEIVRLKKELQDLNRKTEGKELFADGGAAKVASKLMEGIDPNSFKTLSLSTVENMKQSLMSAVDTFDNKELAEKLKAQLEQSFNVTDAGTLANNLKTLLKDMVAAAGGDLEKNTQTFLREKLNAALSNLGSEFNLNDILNFKNYTEADTAVLDTVRQRLTELLKINDNLNKNGDLTTAFIEKLMAVFANGDYAAAIRNIVLALDYYVNAINRAKALNLEDLLVATNGRDDANLISLRIAGIINGYKSLIEILQKENAELKERLNLSKEEATKEPRATGGTIAGSSAAGLAENARLARQYTQELESVKNAELMVGKIEGITQRWFSVYAAVRMVTNAINSMKQTITELDKTITEIAIVTDMSQSDLWGLMDSYTSMAREYAASISGVYKVSQLYYQQGLQTADVMALTESTLKMARISGLDYADATNYMTNAVRSFKMEMTEADRVVDVYSAIAAKSATNVSELAVAMSKTASSAEAVGSSFENTTAMMAVMIEATRESSLNIGSAMKSIISRYGELKEDPGKLVDSEGEELSLNKVDTALQSVGISIHNAQGQFREFDDVIMELAEAWDTIDVNTLRYIATVMAGNRQQSRFLALVGSGERLKQLATEAADAENASQLQFLKTLDSIGAKLQQLETSLLSLYTSSGLEVFYKSVLDIVNNIISSFTAMPTVMNLPIAAIAKFGMTFWSLANVVKSVFAIIMNEILVSKTKFNLLKTGEILIVLNVESLKTAIVEKEEEKRLGIIEDKLKRKKALTEEELNSYAQTQAAKSDKLRNTGSGLIGSFKLAGKEIGVTSLGLNVGALTASMIGSALKSSNNGFLKGAGGLSSIAGSAMQGAAMGSIIPGLGTGVGAVIGTVVGAFLNLNTILPSTAELLKNLTEIADNSKNKALLELAEAKALLSSIDNLKELEKVRYTSTEAEKKYLEASNALATLYPELISLYAKTGEAIVDLTNANILLLKSLQESVSATQNAAKDNYNKAKLERDKESGEQSPVNNLNFDSINTPSDRLLDLGRLFGEVDVNKQYSKQYVDAYTGDSEGVLNLIENLDVKSLVDKYLNGDITENYNELSHELSTLLSDESISGLDQYILLAIQKRFELSGLAISEVAKTDLKLDAVGLTGAVLVANSVLLLNQTEEDILNKVASSNEIINSMILNQWGNYNGDYDKYITEIPKLVENALKTLRDVIGEIGVDAFNEIADYRKGVSATAFNDYLNTKELDNEVKEALKNYFKNVYNIEDFRENAKTIDNTEIQQSLLSFSNEAGMKLSSAELQIVNDLTKNIINLIDSGKLTQTLGMTFLNLYLSVWSNLENELDNTLKEAAELLLLSWDGSKSGLEEILTSLKNNDVDESNKAYLAISNLIPLVSENLNTLMTNLSTSIATSIKDLDDAIKELSKGVSIDKAVEYATKLGVDLSKFELDYSTGLWKYNDLNLILQKYFENIDTLISDAKTMLLLYTDNSVDIKLLIGMSKTLRSGLVGLALYDILGRRGLDKTEVDSIITIFEATGKKVDEFDSWLVEHYTDILKTLNITQENAQARGALLVGNIADFLKLFVEDIDDNLSNAIITSLISNGKVVIDDLRKIKGFNESGLEQYIILYQSSINDSVDSIAQEVYGYAIESVKNGTTTFEVTPENSKYLDEIDATISDDGKTATVNWTELKNDTEAYKNKVEDILSHVPAKTAEEIIQNLEDAIDNSGKTKAFDTLISSYDNIDASQMPILEEALGEDIWELLNVHYDEIAKSWLVNLSDLRAVISNSDINPKDKNKYLANIDKELQDTSVDTALREIGENYNNISYDSIKKLADSLGNKGYDEIKGWFDYDESTGHYSISLTSLLEHYDELAAAGDEAASRVLLQIIDGYLEVLLKVSTVQTSGLTKLEDMRNFASEINYAGNLDAIYRWNDSLKAYVLNSEGLEIAAAEAKLLLDASVGTENENIKKLLINRTKQTLASNIDAMGFVSALQSGDTVLILKSADEFTNAVNDYIAYCTGLDENININADTLESMLASGGYSAVMAAQEIASWKGETLSASDINTLYRSEIDKLNAASELLSYSIGEIINLNTWNILKGIDGFHASEIANGQYVVTSVGNLIEAHEALYKAMSETNEATVRELNAEWAKILNLKSGGEVVEYLSNAAEMTYEAFGEALANVGIEAASLKGSDLYKDLGNGKIEITNFEAFSALLGLSSESTEAYIAAYKEFNAQKIQHENQLRQAIEDEISSLSTAKLGDKIDLTTLYFEASDRFSETAMNGLEESLLKYGAVFDHGILDLSEATSIPNIINIIKNLMQDIDILTEQDFASLADALDNFLKNIVDLINKGIKGTLTNKDKLDLKDNLSNYGIDLNEYDFTKTSEGLLLTEQATMRIWNQLNLIDKLLALLVFKELSASLIANNEKFRTMSSTMNRIVELLEKIATSGNKVSDARLNLYKAELAVAEEIAKVRATSADDSYKFMEADLPAALDNPINYIENWGKAFNVLKEGGKSGFIDAKDFARVVNEMNNIAGLSEEFEFFGQKLDGNLSSASSLIESAFSHIKSVDGKAVVDVKAMMKSLGDVGTAFETGALEADGKVTQGIHAVAQANIDMLDGMIAMLETIVGMQDALSNIDTNFDNELNLEEIFPDLEGNPGKVTDKFADAAKEILKKAEEYPALKEALNTIQIDNHTLADLLKDAKDGAIEAEINYKAFADIMNSFYKMSLSDDYDENNIYESLKQVMEDSGMEDQNYDLNLKDIFITVHQGKVAKITWDDKNIKDVIEEYVKLHGLKNEKGKDGKTAQEQAKEALSKIFAKGNDNNPEVTLEGEELEYFVKLNGAKIVIDPNTKEPYYEYHGQPYRTAEDVLKAIKLELEFPQLKNLTTNYNPEDLGKGGEFTISASLGANLVVKITDSGRTYEYKGHQGETMDEAITAYLTLEDEDYRDLQTKEAQKEYLALYKLNNNLEDKPHFNLKTPKGFNPTQKDSKDFLDYLNSTEEINGKDLEEKFNIKTGIEGPLSVDLIKEVANLFGVDYAMEAKLLSLSVSLAEGTSATLLNLLTGESATATLEITPTIVGSTTSGEGNNSTITLGEQTITAPVKILPTSVLIGDSPEQGIPIPTEQLIKAPVKINPQGTPQLGDALQGITIETEQLVNASIRVNPTDVQLNGNTFLYDKALTVYAAVSNLKLLPGEGGTTAVEGGTGNPLSEQAKALLKLIVDTIWSDDSVNTTQVLQATAYLGEILFATNEGTVNTPPKIVVPQDWIGEDSKLRVKEILTFLYNLEYKPTEEAKAETILVDTPGPLETIDIEQPYRIVFVPEGEGGENEPQPTGLATDADWIRGGIIAGDSKYSDYLTSMSQYLQKGGTLSQAGANSISLIANATRDNAGTQEFYEQFFGENGLFNIDDNGNISAMTTLLLDMGEALSDGELISNMLNLSTLVLEVNSTDSNGLAALWTVLTELKDAASVFMEGPWGDVTSVLNDLSSLNIEAKTLTIDTVLTGQVWALELLKDLSSSTMNLNLNLGGTTTVPPQGPLAGLVPATYPAGTMSPMPYGLINPMMPMGTVFAPLLGVGMPLMQGAMPYGSMASTTPVTPPTQEQPELDTDELEKGIEKVNELISNISTSVDNITKAISEFTSQADAVNGAISDIGSAVSTLQSSISTFATDAGTGATNALAAATALKSIPKEIPINAKVTMSIEPTVTGPGGAAGNVDVKITDISLSPDKVALTQAKAKGTNLALPRGNAQTLMGELGPELYVTNGRYYVAGQSGPEFVDLPKDAIVFNHVKTKLLLKNGKTSGHGKPVTNEKNAISFATGTPGGPAMASASAALAALKQLRAMWASLLKSSAKDLGSLAGRGGGGGGDDAGKYVQPTTTTADIQRWYNWLRLIDKIEKDITYQEKLQKKYETDRVANGLKIFDTLKERLKLLDQEILRNERLADLQKSWYDNKRKELEESSYGKIFTYDENGLQQYVGSGKPGSGLGLDILEHLTKRDVRGEAIGDAATSKAQLKYLASVGFNLNDLIYNDDGTKVVKKINQKTLGLTRMPDDEDTDASELYTKLMENFWSRVDGWRDELDSLYDSYQQQLAKIEDNQTKLNLIIEGFVKNELSVEKELLKAVEAREQAVIDKLQEQKDALEKANANYIKGILKALEKERQIEQKNDQQENLTKLQRLLSILQRSGGGAAQIKQLQDQIAQSLKDMYFNDRLEEINAVQEASDKLLEKLDQQIQILSETLEYQKKNGLLWNQVREIMEGGDEFATAFYDKWVTSKSGESALNMEEDLRAFKESFLEWVGFRESKEEDRLAKEDMESIANSEKYGESNANYLEGFADDKERSAAQKAAEDAANTARDNYLKNHEDEDEVSREANARAAAEKAYHESLQSSYMSTTGNKEANQLFAENYGSWLENRRISDANDFTNTETFKLNENVFKNAMQAYYLEHRNDEGVSEQELWQNAINAGLQALKEDIEENYLEALENSALVIGGKAVSYTWDSVKGKMKKNSKITYGEGTSLSFEEAKEVPEGKKVKHYLRVAGTGNWVLANGIYTGERIYSQLAGNQAWQSWNGNLAGVINGMNGYYGANGLTNTVDISDLKSGSLKFPGTLIPLENGGFATLGKNGNTVRISDFSSITFDKKNPDKKISKLGKNMTITAILTPDMSKMENLLNPMTIKTNGTIKKKLNDLLAADSGSLKNLLQYLGNYDISEIRRYAAGGMNYSTGPAWLDGTKARPEAVLNSSQTSFLRNDLLGNSKDSLKSIVYSLQDSIRGAAIGSSSTTNNDGMVIENIDVTFSPGVISNDYDMRQASEVFKNEIVKIARKSGSRSVSRR